MNVKKNILLFLLMLAPAQACCAMKDALERSSSTPPVAIQPSSLCSRERQDEYSPRVAGLDLKTLKFFIKNGLCSSDPEKLSAEIADQIMREHYEIWLRKKQKRLATAKRLLNTGQ